MPKLNINLCLDVYTLDSGHLTPIFFSPNECGSFFKYFRMCVVICVYFSGQMLCRIEEEHLWESKQLGAHSPFVLLNTLIYFHTKHFILKTAQEHMALSFAQILKHWKKGVPVKGQAAAGKNVSLRFYCLANGKKGN